MGIGYALVSGIESARAVHNALTADGRQMPCHTSSVARHYASYRVRQLQYYSMEQRWPDSPFWSRRQLRKKVNTSATAAESRFQEI